VVIEHRDEVEVGMRNIPCGCNEPDLLRTEPLCDLACEVMDGAPEGRRDVVIEFVEGTYVVARQNERVAGVGSASRRGSR
jgi:hypothetical protein